MVTVIIPCYNCEKYIEQTLDSVLNQSYSDFKIIAIDDCSTDTTLQILKEYSKKYSKVKIHSNKENLGVAHTRNKGVKMSNFPYIAFLDADDVWEKEKLAVQMKYLIENTEVDVACTSYLLCNEELSEQISIYKVPKDIKYKTLMYENVIGLSTVVLKKEVFQKFEMNNKYMHEDYELWLKLLRNGYKAVGLHDVLVKYRVYNQSRNTNKINALKERMKILYYEEKINFFNILIYTLVYGIRGLKKYKKIVNWRMS